MSTTKGNTGARRTHTAPHGVDPSLLEAEISFWREMIRFRSATVTNETLERMQQALELAQCKLEYFSVPDECAGNIRNQTAGNVHFITHRTKIQKN